MAILNNPFLCNVNGGLTYSSETHLYFVEKLNK